MEKCAHSVKKCARQDSDHYRHLGGSATSGQWEALLGRTFCRYSKLAWCRRQRDWALWPNGCVSDPTWWTSPPPSLLGLWEGSLPTALEFSLGPAPPPPEGGATIQFISQSRPLPMDLQNRLTVFRLRGLSSFRQAQSPHYSAAVAIA